MPRRNQESFPELLHAVLRKVPWWIGPLLIAATYIVSRWAIPSLIDVPQLQYDGSTPEKAVGFANQIFGKAGADFSRMAAPWASLFVAGVWLFALAAKYQDSKQKPVNSHSREDQR